MSGGTGIAVSDAVATANGSVLHRTHPSGVDFLGVNALSAFASSKNQHTSSFCLALVAVGDAVAATNWSVDFHAGPVGVSFFLVNASEFSIVAIGFLRLLAGAGEQHDARQKQNQGWKNFHDGCINGDR